MIKILTCKIGENIINTFEYADEQIRKWSNKGILKCPVCNSEMIYKHGEIKIAHFAHGKDADCKNIYSEPETEEHMLGKKMLFEWLKQQEGIENLKLESWIPETKQRPDLYFEIGNKRYVIEFQCTPIATEHIQRHRLYELAGIKDIWILGMQKYNILATSLYIAHSDRFKAIEKYNYCYLDIHKGNIIINKSVIFSCLKYKELKLDNYYTYNLKDIYLDFTRNQLTPMPNILSEFLKKDEEEYSKVKEQRIAEAQRKHQEKIIKEKEQKQKSFIVNECRNLVKTLNEQFKIVNKKCQFDLHDNNSEYYLCKIEFTSSDFDYTFFIKIDRSDCCIEEPCTRMELLGGRGKRGGLRRRYYKSTRYDRKTSLQYDEFSTESLRNFICDIISTSLRKYKYGVHANKGE